MENEIELCYEDDCDGLDAPPIIDEGEAKNCLQRFFKGKNAHFGGPIPNSVLITERNLSLLCKLELGDCIDIFHMCLEENGWTGEQARVDEFFRIQHEAMTLEIPKHYSGGILLVWLDICCGYELN